MRDEDVTGSTASPRRLLLVVCNDNFRRTLTRILGRCGYTVDGAPSGEEALRRLEESRYDGIISDVHLPGQVSGITLMRQMRAAGRDVPIIFLTEEETTRIRSALESGRGVECLQVPLDLERLKRIVGACCGR